MVTYALIVMIVLSYWLLSGAYKQAAAWRKDNPERSTCWRPGRIDDRFVAGWLLLSITILVALLLAFVGTGMIMSDKARLAAARQNQSILEERYQAQAAVVRLELSRYPEYEREILRGIDPLIVVSYPNLRVADTTMALVQQVVKLRDATYENRQQINALQQDIDYMMFMWWPTL